MAQRKGKTRDTAIDKKIQRLNSGSGSPTRNSMGVPVCRMFVYRESTPKENKSDPRIPRTASLPQNLPEHNPSAYGDPNLNQIPWYCVVGFGEDLSSKINYEGKEEELVRDPLGWQLVSCRVNHTRIWSCSQATVQIARPLDRDNPHSSEFGHQFTEKHNKRVYEVFAPPVRPEDVIVIEMGYTDSMISKQCSVDTVFYGIVDTVKERGGSGENDGVTVTIIARDTMRYLVDNKIRGHIVNWGAAALKQEWKYNRAYLVRDLIYRGAAINYVKYAVVSPTQFGKSPGGFKQPLSNADAGKNEPGKDPDLFVQEDFNKQNSYVRIGKIERSNRKDSESVAANNTAQKMVLMDRFPLDIIKHFSLVETAPRELFADQRTGQIHWMFRRTDARKLYGGGKTKKLFNGKALSAEQQKALTRSRQYFYRFPEDRANIMAYTAEWTTIGSITHFSVTNTQVYNSGEEKTKELYIESPIGVFDDIHGTPKADGQPKKLRRFTRNRFVYDESTLNNTVPEEIALALFTVWGRDIETGMVHVPGDPTLEIGEAIQLFNTGLFGRRYQPTAGGTPQAAFTKGPDGGSGPEGIYRVEAVNHMFAAGGAQKGYTTVFIFGPCDPPGGTAENKRLIEDDADLASLKTVPEEGA